MSLQISGSIMRGMLGTWPHGGTINPPGVLLFIGVAGLIIWIALKQKGFLQSIGIFIGAMVGWLIAIAAGISEPPVLSRELISLPELLPWGPPQFDPGLFIILLVVGFFTLSNLVTSISSFSELVGQEASEKDFNQATIVTGIGNVFAGYFCPDRFCSIRLFHWLCPRDQSCCPSTISDRCNYPDVAGAVPDCRFVICCDPAPGGLCSHLNHVCQLLSVAFDEYRKVTFDNRNGFIVGISFAARGRNYVYST
jgi:hypothetical protein